VPWRNYALPVLLVLNLLAPNFIIAAIFAYTVVTFRVRRSRAEMYIDHTRLCVSVLAAFPHYCTDSDVTLENGTVCPLVVHYWADLQSVQGFVAATT